MKKTKTVSAILFGLLFAIQSFLMSYVLLGMGLSNVPIYFLAEIAAIVVFAMLCVKLLKDSEPLCPSFKKALAVGTVLYLVFTALCYQMQLSAIIQSISILNAAWGASMVPGIIALCIKVALLVAAVAVAMMEPKVTEVTLEFEEAQDANTLQSEEAVEAVIEAIEDKENV